MSSTQITLRPYQTEAINAVFGAWAGGMRRPAIVLPTGAGKTVVFSELVRQWRESGRPGDPTGSRVVILAHRDELVDQAISKLRAVLPESMTVGKVKAQDREVSADVMVCSVQTLARGSALHQMTMPGLGDIGLIITDECHHAAATSYGKVYDAFPDALHLGVTATMARGDRVGLGSVWDDVVYKRSVLWMISKGYLTDVQAKQVNLWNLDLDQVRRSFATLKNGGSDYQAGDLGRALMEAEAHVPITKAYVEHAGSRPGIVFAPTVATAEAVAEEMSSAGVRTAVVSGETPRDERLRIFDDFRTGKVQVLSNCMVLTEGFDAPWAEVAVIARPTQSQPLYVQMVGRVLRPYPGKDKALVLDVVGASASNKLRTLVDLDPGVVQSMKDGESLEEAVVREAEEQNQTVPAGSLAFELKVKEANLFGGSEYTWVRTPGGVLYINCGETYVFLWPSPGQRAGTWDVCTAPVKGGAKWQRTSHTALDIGSAMAWGEAVSEDHYAGFSTKRTAQWRAGKPSQAQLDYADVLGIKDAASMRRGQLGEAIDLIKGAQFFDRYVK